MCSGRLGDLARLRMRDKQAAGAPQACKDILTSPWDRRRGSKAKCGTSKAGRRRL